VSKKKNKDDMRSAAVLVCLALVAGSCHAFTPNMPVFGKAAARHFSVASGKPYALRPFAPDTSVNKILCTSRLWRWEFRPISDRSAYVVPFSANIPNLLAWKAHWGYTGSFRPKTGVWGNGQPVMDFEGAGTSLSINF
jgi:hypothetical protein